jgi:hypothetical protein
MFAPGWSPAPAMSLRRSVLWWLSPHGRCRMNVQGVLTVLPSS